MYCVWEKAAGDGSWPLFSVGPQSGQGPLSYDSSDFILKDTHSNGRVGTEMANISEGAVFFVHKQKGLGLRQTSAAVIRVVCEMDRMR